MNLRTPSFLGIVATLILTCLVAAQSPAPPSDVTAFDTPNDGRSIS